MKKWELPQVKINQFVANEYVASCTPSSTGSGFSLICDNQDTHDYGYGQYTDDHDSCSTVAMFPSGALQGTAGNYTNSVTYDSNGNHLTGLDGTLDAPAYDTLDPSKGKTNAEYVFQAFYNQGKGMYYYNIYVRYPITVPIIGTIIGYGYKRTGWHAAFGDYSANPNS